MFKGLLKPKFYNKCKTAIKLTKTRLESINRKRSVVEKYLKGDIADLLKNNLDYNAYSRAEGLLVEQNRTCCYRLIEEFCGCISPHLSSMAKQSECPEECREAVSSLVFAAARFADLPELRDLRTLFSEKYGSFVENFVNKEFLSRLRPEPPSKEMKVQMMRDIAMEFSFEWDSKALEQKLFVPPPRNNTNEQVRATSEPREEKGAKEEPVRSHRTRERRDVLPKTEDDCEPEARGDRRNIRAQASKDASDKNDRVSPLRKAFTVRGVNKPSSPVEDVPEEEELENKKPSYRNIPPPYVLAKAKENDGGGDLEPQGQSSPRPKPRSVRQRRQRPQPETKTDDVDEEEKAMDGLLMHYSKKELPYELDSDSMATGLKKPASLSRRKGADQEVVTPPSRVASLPPEPVDEADQRAKVHSRMASLQPEMSGGHVHPKLPEYDDLAARIAALRSG